MKEPRRLALVGILSDRIKTLAAARDVPYGEQRLIYHMLEPAMRRYAGRAKEGKIVATLYDAMKAYTEIERKNDVIGLTMKTWSSINSRKEIADSRMAVKVLGHWDPVMRRKASTYIGIKIAGDKQLAETVFRKLRDPRDEVRASAARVFSFASDYKPPRVINEMVRMLIQDPGVTVQKAASEALMTHSDTSEAASVVKLLINQVENYKPSPGPKRMSSILTTLSYYIDSDTIQETKDKLVEIGVKYLAFAPSGALRLLEGLGRDARRAIPAIKKYRDTEADRFTRRKINRNVLWAIDPTSSIE